MASLPRPPRCPRGIYAIMVWCLQLYNICLYKVAAHAPSNCVNQTPYATVRAQTTTFVRDLNMST